MAWERTAQGVTAVLVSDWLYYDYTLEGLVDSKVESHIGCYPQDGGEQSTVQATTPETTFFF